MIETYSIMATLLVRNVEDLNLSELLFENIKKRKEIKYYIQEFWN